MAVSDKTYYFDDLHSAIIDFEHVGDVFPIHIHTDPLMNHVSVIARGAIICHGDPGIEGKIGHTGDLIQWPLNQRHGFEALESRTRIINFWTKLGG